MPLKPLFERYQPVIQHCFERAKADAGFGAASVQLVIAEKPRSLGRNRAEVLAIGTSGPVRMTWNAIASLWALSQGAAHLSKRMFEARRRGESRLIISDDPELTIGLNSLVLANRFRFDDPPLKFATPKYWPAWAVVIDPYARKGSDSGVGNRLFRAALGWIFRHELAHITFGHNDVTVTNNRESRELESEADDQATEWLQGSLESDPHRDRGAAPAAEELALEARAIAVGIALLWVALMEPNRPEINAGHPAVAERVFAAFEKLGLREDSGAKEILADLIKLWIDPEA